MARNIAILLLGVIMAGCTQIQEPFLSISSKVNKAFPPNTEVRLTEENLRMLIKQDTPALKRFEEAYNQRLELRALTCIQDLSIGRFDSVKSVQKLPINKDCLNNQDAQLLRYLGILQVATRVAQPSLRPLAKLGPAAIVPSSGVEVYSGNAASAAGVAVLRGTRDEFISIELPGGKKIVSLPTIPDASHTISLSPNGRITAIPVRNNGLTFVDNETGTKLWETKDINKLYAWLPEVSAALVQDSKTGDLMVLDFQTGKLTPHAVPLRHQTWGLRVGGSSSNALVGTSRQFSLIEHTRAPEGLKATVTREYHIKSGHGVTSSPPTLMRDGKAIVFISSRDFMLLNLETGKETFWPTGDFLGNRYGKLSETTLLVDSYESNIRTKPLVFNIEQVTLSAVETEEGSSGILAELEGRTGYMRRGYKQVWFGDEVIAGKPESLDSLLSAFNLERQITRLKALDATQETEKNQPLHGIDAEEIAIAPDQGPELGREVARIRREMARIKRLHHKRLYEQRMQSIPRAPSPPSR